MKFRVTMKTPDALNYAIGRAVHDGFGKWTPDEVVAFRAAKTLCDRWFGDEETLTVEIDTEAKTCVVVER